MLCEGVSSLCQSKYSVLLINAICNSQYVSQTRDEFYISVLDPEPIELSVALHTISGRVLVSNLLSCQPQVNVDDTI